MKAVVKKGKKKKRYQTGRVCEQKFASAKNGWIIPREFHSSLITAVKDRLGPRSRQLPSRRSISSSVSAERACLPYHASFFPCHFQPVQRRCGLSTRRRQRRSRQHSRPGRRSFWSPPRAISLSRHHLRSQSERYERNVPEAGSSSCCRTNAASGAPRAELSPRSECESKVSAFFFSFSSPLAPVCDKAKANVANLKIRLHSIWFHPICFTRLIAFFAFRHIRRTSTIFIKIFIRTTLFFFLGIFDARRIFECVVRGKFPNRTLRSPPTRKCERVALVARSIRRFVFHTSLVVTERGSRTGHDLVILVNITGARSSFRLRCTRLFLLCLRLCEFKYSQQINRRVQFSRHYEMSRFHKQLAMQISRYKLNIIVRGSQLAMHQEVVFIFLRKHKKMLW